MNEIATESISLKEIYDLAFDVFCKYGCNQENATALSKIVHNAERDGSLSHGLFRVPGYIASLKSGKVRGNANPSIEHKLSSIISVNGDYGFAPYHAQLYILLHIASQFRGNMQ